MPGYFLPSMIFVRRGVSTGQKQPPTAVPLEQTQPPPGFRRGKPRMFPSFFTEGYRNWVLHLGKPSVLVETDSGPWQTYQDRNNVLQRCRFVGQACGLTTIPAASQSISPHFNLPLPPRKSSTNSRQAAGLTHFTHDTFHGPTAPTATARGIAPGQRREEPVEPQRGELWRGDVRKRPTKSAVYTTYARDALGRITSPRLAAASTRYPPDSAHTITHYYNRDALGRVSYQADGDTTGTASQTLTSSACTLVH